MAVGFWELGLIDASGFANACFPNLPFAPLFSSSPLELSAPESAYNVSRPIIKLKLPLESLESDTTGVVLRAFPVRLPEIALDRTAGDLDAGLRPIACVGMEYTGGLDSNGNAAVPFPRNPSGEKVNAAPYVTFSVTPLVPK